MKENLSRNRLKKSWKERSKKSLTEERKLLIREISTPKLTRNCSKYKLRLLSKRRKRMQESKSMLKRRRLLSISSDKRKLSDSPKSNQLDKLSLIDKFTNL